MPMPKPITGNRDGMIHAWINQKWLSGKGPPSLSTQRVITQIVLGLSQEERALWGKAA